jgi:predicted ester cyclase
MTASIGLPGPLLRADLPPPRDDTVIAELWMSGTHRGPRPGVEATGKRFRCRLAAFFRFEGDALVGVRVYYDTATIARQLA